MSHIHISIHGYNNPADFSETIDISKIKLMNQTLDCKDKILQTSLLA